MTQSEKVDQLFTALSAAQGEIRDAVRDSRNPHFNSTYADLATVLQTSRAVLAKHGLCVVQLPSYDADRKTVNITTTIGHSSGQWISETLAIPLNTERRAADAQAVGSAITYGRRYAYMAAIGIAADDDDGNAASGLPSIATPRQTERRPGPEPAATATKPEKPQRQANQNTDPQSDTDALPPIVSDAIARVKAAPSDKRRALAVEFIEQMHRDLAEAAGRETADAKLRDLLASIGVSQPSGVSTPAQLRLVLLGLYGHLIQSINQEAVA